MFERYARIALIYEWIYPCTSHSRQNSSDVGLDLGCCATYLSFKQRIAFSVYVLLIASKTFLMIIVVLEPSPPMNRGLAASEFRTRELWRGCSLLTWCSSLF
jgi:hypothetical protein